MATTYKILGQASPSNTTANTLYTVPGSTSAVVSTITATNVSGTADRISIFVVASGDSPTTANALVSEALLNENSVQAFTIGLTLSANDVISVQSTTGSSTTYQAFGTEIS